MCFDKYCFHVEPVSITDWVRNFTYILYVLVCTWSTVPCAGLRTSCRSQSSSFPCRPLSSNSGFSLCSKHLDLQVPHFNPILGISTNWGEPFLKNEYISFKIVVSLLGTVLAHTCNPTHGKRRHEENRVAEGSQGYSIRSCL